MPSLSEAERRSVLHLARQALVEAVLRQQLFDQIPASGIFLQRCGLFVTIQVCGRLRGCIGVIEGDESLGATIVRCAVSAALQDSRFSPLRAEELEDLEIEISLLSQISPISPEHIEIGRHGLLISQGAQRGLLLPQVATGHLLSREEFLEETCRKAGLHRNAWREPETQIFGFTCEVFSDRGLPADR
jgi:AmmeMemoRadiSam system protein A